MPHPTTPVDVGVAIDQQVKKVLQAAGVVAPPVDALHVARSLGMKLAWDNDLAGRARIVRLNHHRHASTTGAIFLKPEPRGERRQWAVAHEIGESVAHDIFAELGTNPADVGEAAREQIANIFASRLLLPTDWFNEAATKCEWDVVQLKTHFTTASHEIIARRMLDFSPQIIVTIFDQQRITFRQGNGGTRPPALTDLERNCQRQVHTASCSYSVQGEDVAIQGWPVHEEPWRREILRLESLIDW